MNNVIHEMLKRYDSNDLSEKKDALCPLHNTDLTLCI